MDYNILKKNSVFIEVGSFENYGGWVLDTQFIPNMGSAYLLAHGLGEPVENAQTKIELPETGTYRLWVFTKDWVAYWKKNCSPGLFKISIDGKECDTVFGTEGCEWAWQDGGIVEITSPAATIALCDLTGFEGRCGGILLTKDLEFVPPNDIDENSKMRRVLCGNEDTKFLGEYDIVIAGGGISGICAAVSAARDGLKTALIHDRDVVGGNNSSEVRVWLGGETNFEPFPNIGNITNEFEQETVAHYGAANVGEIYEDERKMSVLQNEENLDVFTGYFLVDAKMNGNEIESVIIYNVRTGKYGELSAKLFADCTGDGNLGYYAGADFEVTTNGHMGMTNVWHVEDMGSEQIFPSCPWAIDLTKVDFPGRRSVENVYGQTGSDSLGCWYWESGMEHDPIKMVFFAREPNNISL